MQAKLALCVKDNKPTAFLRIKLFLGLNERHFAPEPSTHATRQKSLFWEIHCHKYRSHEIVINNRLKSGSLIAVGRPSLNNNKSPKVLVSVDLKTFVMWLWPVYQHFSMLRSFNKSDTYLLLFYIFYLFLLLNFILLIRMTIICCSCGQRTR